MLRVSSLILAAAAANAPKNLHWYHGSARPRINWSMESAGREDATDQEGPGIYFTTDLSDARSYGEHISEVKLNLNKNRTVPLRGKLNETWVRVTVKKAPDLADTLTNWDENPRRAFEVAIQNLLEYNEGPHDLLQTIYSDFFKGHPQEFFKAIGRSFDGVVLPRSNGVLHAVIYNPAVIQTIRMTTRTEIDATRQDLG